MNTSANDFSKHGQAISDSAAGAVRGGIRTAQGAAADVGDMLANKVDDLRGAAGPMLRKTSQRARDSLANTSDAIISYTQENPALALAIAAASGALLYGLVKIVQAARD